MTFIIETILHYEPVFLNIVYLNSNRILLRKTDL